MSAACSTAEWLAREAATDDVDSTDDGKGSHVVENRDIWPVLSEDALAEGVTLAEGDDSHPGALKAERESADAAE